MSTARVASATRTTRTTRTARIAQAVGIVGAIGIVAIALNGCGDDFDPARSAENGIHDQILVELELDSEVDCDQPASHDVGERFSCVAEDEEGHTYHFVAEILPDEVIGTFLD
jgi:hypothetical protein